MGHHHNGREPQGKAQSPHRNRRPRSSKLSGRRVKRWKRKRAVVVRHWNKSRSWSSTIGRTMRKSVEPLVWRPLEPGRNGKQRKKLRGRKSCNLRPRKVPLQPPQGKLRLRDLPRHRQPRGKSPRRHSQRKVHRPPTPSRKRMQALHRHRLLNSQHHLANQPTPHHSRGRLPRTMPLAVPKGPMSARLPSLTRSLTTRSARRMKTASKQAAAPS